MFRIKRHDTVVVIAGKDKGKRGRVLEIDIDKNRVKVAGVAVITKHYKARRKNEESSIKKQESYIDASKVMLVDPHTSLPCRVNFKLLDDGTKVRVSNRTKQTL